MSGLPPVSYTAPGVNPWRGMSEATRKDLTREEIVDRVYSTIKRMGVLSPDANEAEAREIISGAISYRDGDAYLDVDFNEIISALYRGGYLNASNLSAFTGEEAARFLTSLLAQDSVPGLTRFFPDGIRLRIDERAYKTLALQAQIDPDAAFAPGHLGEIRDSMFAKKDEISRAMLSINEASVADRGAGRPEFSTIGDAALHIQGAYDSSGTVCMNMCLHEFLHDNFIHLHNSVQGANMTGWGTHPQGITLETSLDEGFSVNENGQRRIDCDVYADIGCQIVASIRLPDGQPAFNARVVEIFPVMYPYNSPQARPIGHAVLVFTDNTTGVTYVMDNDRVHTVPEGMQYIDFIRTRMGYSDATDFGEYTLSEHGDEQRGDKFHVMTGEETLRSEVLCRYEYLDPPLSEEEINGLISWIARESGIEDPENVGEGQIIVYPNDEDFEAVTGRSPEYQF